MKKRITRITAALAAAALLAGCGSISSKDGGYYTTEAASAALAGIRLLSVPPAALS